MISEVDAFVLTRKGAYLIEIKSTPGRLTGDQQRWTFHRPDGGRTITENPLLVTNRKAKRIKSLLEQRWRHVAGDNASPRPPFIQPVVFLSDRDLKVELSPDARVHVYGRDGSSVTESNALEGILAAVGKIGAAEANNPRFRQLNTPTTAAVAKALDEIGIKESNHTRRVGSWILRLDTVADRPGIQDFVADHENSPGIQRRVRIYSRQPQMSDDQATSLRLAADREFIAAERITHPNVVRALERFDTDLGSAVVFEHEPTAVRLDHWLEDNEDLDLDDRLAVLRQLAETMQAVHRRKVTHRALSPGSVLVRPGRADEPKWVVLVTDFSLAGRDHPASRASTVGSRVGTRAGTGFGLPSALPGDADLLADTAAQLFCAPELATEEDPDGVSLDVFSFGALAFEVLSGRPPGDSRDAVRTSLQAGRGLQLAAAAPGVADGLHDLVLEATRPLVSERLSSFDDVVAWLDMAEEQLTAPPTVSAEPEAAEIDPLNAKPGATLGDGAMVKRQLGRGSTARALLVDRGAAASPAEVVYKVSLGGDADARLRQEGELLGGVRHPAVVECFGQIELAGRPVLVEALAGTQSLADELRRNGTPGIEFLERWGSDLLEALRFLEREGRFHRDIKPDNLGVTEIGANREQHLVLFDFSLASVSSTDLRAGTPPYLEPFLADRPDKKWDLAAERYAAAITLYEMATGEVPRWGDGRSDPAFTDSDVSLDVVLFDPAARDPLEQFFTRALRRDPDDRFGNAEEMLRAWQRVFEDLDAAPEGATGTQEDETETGPAAPVRLPDALAIGDPILSLGSSAKVVSALNRLGVTTVRQLADLAPSEVTRARRISPRVRRRIVELRAAVLLRFADDLAEATPTTTVPGTTSPDVDEVYLEAPRLDLDRLVPLLVPPAPKAGKKGSTQPAVRMMLGLDPVPGAETSDWASQTAIAEALGVTRGRLGQIGPAVRKTWAELAPLHSVRDELVELIATNDGVAGVREVEIMLADARGSGLPPDAAAQAARAVVRAAIEAEELGGTPDAPAVPRIVVRRRGARVIVALDIDPPDGEADDSIVAAFETGFDGQALGAYAAALGDKADELVESNQDVIPQDRAVAQLRLVPPPEAVALADGRLLRLAASCSQKVAVSSALELYPVDIDPVRALRLARQSLASATELTVEGIQARVQARFPRATLPSRPELDAALAAADVVVTWAGDRFKREATVVGDLSTMTSVVSRQPTGVAPSRPSRPPTADIDPEVAQAIDVEGRLQRSLAHGGFLALRVATGQGPAARRELARFTGDPHRMVTIDLESWFLEELRAAAGARKVAWEKLIAADLAPEGSTDHTNLRILTRDAAARLEERVAGAGSRVLAWNPGVLAAYDELDMIDRLRESAGKARAGLQTLWLVVYGPSSEDKPTVNGRPVPVLGRSEWLDLPIAWLANRHGQHLPTGTDAGTLRGPV